MTDLVIAKRGEVFVDSRLIANKFKKKHAYVVDVIKKLHADFNAVRVGIPHPKAIEREGEYRGQKYAYYLMDRKFFSHLVVRFRGREAFEWQVKFIEAFFEMEKQLALVTHNKNNEQWLAQREQSKLVRREETDVIKEFVEYATKQGSQSAKFYYKHITVAVYKCLGLIQFEKPKLRETLDLLQTSQLILAEMTARKSLQKYMQQGEHYKAIFTLVKQDLENFANAFILPNMQFPEEVK